MNITLFRTQAQGEKNEASTHDRKARVILPRPAPPAFFTISSQTTQEIERNLQPLPCLSHFSQLDSSQIHMDHTARISGNRQLQQAALAIGNTQRSWGSRPLEL